MTVTRMATRRDPIPVTVDTFEASGGGWGGIPWERGAQTHIDPKKIRILVMGTLLKILPLPLENPKP